MNTARKGQKLPLFNRVGVLRADRKMSRAQLAEIVGVNPQTIGAMERGDHSPSLDLALRVCEVFGLPVEAVFARSEFGPLYPPTLPSGETDA
ncbi:helix-turn-helix transcriptional regulator [Tomitella biformata]|uniref:helix-turn-helix transcriptional regulator n=1 Tax=Tomitella biformata TaxID=630403 RepID=UPI0004B936A9|nr:helix-turn-helix transcriptional regulator [Tomitella biformata]